MKIKLTLKAMTSPRTIISRAFDVLYDKTYDFYFYLDGNVPEVSEIEPLQFCRDYVSKNIPVVIRGGCSSWPATNKWNADYFRKTIRDNVVEVAVTPNGLGDSIAELHGVEYCVWPHQTEMTMTEFLDCLEEKRENVVPNIQKQNSNLILDLNELMCDVEPELKFASQAFNKSPEDVNFWMGDGRAIISMNRNYHEDIFCVIDGWREFLLIPPTDLPYVPYDNYPHARYRYEEGALKMASLPCYESPMPTPWISVDPQNPDYTKYPQFKKARQFRVRLEKGDCLYVPSLWFHHETQSHGSIAVSYWYDMDHDLKYCYFEMLDRVCDIHKEATLDAIRAARERDERESGTTQCTCNSAISLARRRIADSVASALEWAIRSIRNVSDFKSDKNLNMQSF